MKRILKSFVSALVAVCACTAIAMPVFATGNVLYGDVNQDGIVSMSDIVIFNKYLLGRCDITNYTAADVNQNYLLDYVDRDLIQAYLVQLISALPYQISD